MTGLEVKWALRLPALDMIPACNCWSGSSELMHGDETYTAGGLQGPAELKENLGGKAEPIGIRLNAEIVIGSDETDMKKRLMDDPGTKAVELLMLWRPSSGMGAWTTARTYVGLISRVEVDGTELAVEIDTEVPKVAQQAKPFDPAPPCPAKAELPPAVWSEREQRAFNPGDRFFEHLGALAKGVSVVWPS